MSNQKPHITKEWLLSAANKGPQGYGDAKLEVYTSHSDVFDEDLISLKLYPLNAYTTSARFGGCPITCVSEPDCEQLTSALDRAVERMRSAERIAHSQPIEMEWQDANTLISHEKRRPYVFERYRDEHFSIYIPNKAGEPEHAISTPVILDGKLYTATYSFWLERSVYLLEPTKPLYEQEVSNQ